MVTKANRERARKPRKKVEHQADDVYVPSSLRKDFLPLKVDIDMGSKADVGEPFSPVAIYLISSTIAFAGGLGLGWAVWG